MKGHEQSASILRTELVGVIERQRQRSPMSGKRQERIFGRRTAAHLLSISPVLGGEHFLLELVAVVTIGPPKVIAPFNPDQLLGWIVGVPFRAEPPVVSQLVSPVDVGI